jgi:hypothetical protein
VTTVSPEDRPKFSPEPFFVTGFQRSGTTLLRMMLDSHPEVAIPLDTTGLWARAERRLSEFGPLEEDANRRRLIESLLAEERIRLWQVPLSVDEVISASSRPGYPGVIEGFHLAYAHSKGKSRWGDKDPGNMVRLPSVLGWFPDARVVHIVRDGRDACLSLLKQSFGGDDLLRCAEQWREQVGWVRQIGRILGEERYHELRYEDLVEDPEAVLRPLARFLDLEWSPAMLEYHRRVEESVPEQKRHIWPLLDRPPQASARYRWKREMSTGERICFEKRAGRMLAEFGYETLPGGASGAYLTEAMLAARRVSSAIAGRLRRR